MPTITEIELRRIEKELNAIYSKAYAELKKELDKVVSKMEFQADMTATERFAAASKYNRINTMVEQMTDSLANTNKKAMRILNREQVNIYQKNYNNTIEFLEEYSDIVFPVIDKGAVAKILRGEINPFKQIAMDDIKNNAALRTNLTRTLTSGIMQGKSIPNLTKDLRGLVDRDLISATRIVRTETATIANAAQQEAGDQGEKLGLYLVKHWVSTKDNRTRTTPPNEFDHVKANGMTVPNDMPFIINGEELMFPADENASAGNRINCRCITNRSVVTKAQYDYVVEQYEARNYFPDWKSVQDKELEKTAQEKAAKRESEKTPTQLAEEKAYREKAAERDKLKEEAKARSEYIQRKEREAAAKVDTLAEKEEAKRKARKLALRKFRSPKK